jgi:hypothetical protein
MENAEYFKYFYRVITNYARRTHEIQSRTSMTKEAIKKKQSLLYQQVELKLKRKAVNCSIWSVARMVLKLGPFGTKIKNTRKDVKRGSGKGRRSFGMVVLKIRKYYIE